jgi:phytoene dehydrogenase-like protein
MRVTHPLGSGYDAVVVGAGPNGLAAAIELARAKLSVLVVEAKGSPGGGVRTEALTLPGFSHDTCSTVHPLGIGSPLFRALDLGRFGLEWLESSAPLVHVLDPSTAITLERSIDATAEQLGEDKRAYLNLVGPFLDRFDELLPMLLAPLRFPPKPILLARFGLLGLRSIASVSRRFRGKAAPALLGGIAAHAMLPLHDAATAAFALVLATAGHRFGWPVARGGSQSITRALVDCFTELGGRLVLDYQVRTMDDLPPARAYLFDVTPKQLVEIAGGELPSLYRRRLARFRYGPGVFKMDWALRAPIPWRNPACARATTVHLSGELEQIHRCEAALRSGRIVPSPFTLVVQPTLADPSRAPAGHHTAWAYCHVPRDSDVDASAMIEGQIERYAPGFREVVIARSARGPRDLQRENANYVGGDINGGSADIGQLFFRPVARLDPYATGAHNIFVCSSSTPPGGGVHGMCGYWAARSVLGHVFPKHREAAPGYPVHRL